MRILQRKGRNSQGPNQAASKDEHIVVVGSRGGKKIEKRVVRLGANLAEDLNMVISGNLMLLEHHQDPPSKKSDVKNDGIVRVDDPGALKSIEGQSVIGGNVGVIQPSRQ